MKKSPVETRGPRLTWETAILTVLLLGGGAACADEPDLPAELRAQLQANADALNRIDVTWSTRRTSPLSESEVTQIIGTSDRRPEFFGPWDFHVRFHDQKSYSMRSSNIMVTQRGVLNEQLEQIEKAFNGSVVFEGSGISPKVQSSPILSIRTQEERLKSAHDRKFTDAQYFEYAGYRVRTRLNEVIEAMPPRSLVLDLLDFQFAELTSLGEAMLQDRTCTTVELRKGDRKFSIWLDPELKSAVCQIQVSDISDQLLYRATSSNFTRLGENGPWLPEFIEVGHFVYPEPPLPTTNRSQTALFVDEITVSRLQCENFTPEMFTLQYPTGTFVSDYTLVDGNRVSYRIPANRDDLDKIIAEATQGIRPLGQQSLRRLLMVVAGTVVVLLVVATYMMKQRSAR